MRIVEYNARVHQAEDDSFWAEVVELPGCFASGFTLDELRDSLSEAISLYVADDPGAGHVEGFEPELQPVSVQEMRLSVAAA